MRNPIERLRVAALLLVLPTLVLAGCADDVVLSPDPDMTETAPSAARDRALGRYIRQLASERGITPMPRAPQVRDGLRKLGEMLVFDRILSGNRDISCMTCHHPTLGLGDGRSMAIGQGAAGLGAARVHPAGAFIPRNAPALFNLHLLDNFFWDGRVSLDDAGRIHTPAGDELTPDMTAVMEFGALSAVGLFPVLSREEMRALPGENELADYPDSDMRGVWTALMSRLGSIPRYRELFEAAYPGTRFDDMSFAHATNAMAGFILDAFVFSSTPWDRFLNGDDRALSDEQMQGALAFLNAPCAQCHNGPGFSDDDFHNVALAQFGPGHGNGSSGRDDFGRMNVTGSSADIYRFRSTMLRNVELTGPYGHAGEFADLAGFIDHYSSSAEKLRAYSAPQVPEPLLIGTLLDDNREDIIATRDPLILPVTFDSVFVREVTSFMRALTDARARNLSHMVPRGVPSGLAVDR